MKTLKNIINLIKKISTRNIKLGLLTLALGVGGYMTGYTQDLQSNLQTEQKRYSKIAFVSWRDYPIGPIGGSLYLCKEGIYVMDSDGSNLKEVYAKSITELGENGESYSYPQLSPNGKKIVFNLSKKKNWKIYDSEVYIINSDGTDLTNLTNNSAIDRVSSFSPSGKKILFDSERDRGIRRAYIMDIDGGNQDVFLNLETLLNLSYSCPSSDALICPDGKLIAFTSISSKDKNPDIYMITQNADGLNIKNLTDHPAEDYFPSFSPDWRKMVFTSNRDENNEIYIMNIGGTGLTNLTNNLADDDCPSFSPDGKKIVFHSDRGGNYEIYTIDIDGKNLKNLTNNPDLDMFPSWSPFLKIDG